MSSDSTDARPGLARSARYVIVVAGTVAVLGALATSRLAFAFSVALSALLAFGTMAVALRRGQDALAAGEPAKAGAVAGILLVARLVGLAGMMIVATAAPAVLDMWGVVAGMIAADAVLLYTEGLSVLTVA